MKKLAFLFIAVFSCSIIFAQTIIKDKQEVSGVWKKSGSPYIIEGEAIVPNGKLLTIKPGVIIKFKTGTNRDYSSSDGINKDFDLGFLRVNGKIIAKGKKKKLITFTRFGSTGSWGSVHIKTSEKDIQFQYCKFEYSHFVRGVVPEDNATGALSFYSSSGTVANCLFLNKGWAAVNCKVGANPTIKNITIVGYQYGIECNSGSSPSIESSIIWNAGNAFYINDKSLPRISYSLVQGDELPSTIIDGKNNIMGTAPEFTNPQTGDYSIKKTSPAYKKGKEGSNIGAL